MEMENIQKQCMCLVAQSCPTLRDPMDCSLLGSSVLGDSLGENTGVGCHALLQGIFPSQGLSPGLPHCRRILYCLSHGESESETAAQSCLTLCDPMDCSLPGSSIHGIFQASPPKNTIAQKIPVNLLFYVCYVMKLIT